MTDQKITPKAVWEQQHEYVRKLDAEGQASLFADDAVWEFPLAPEGIPKRIQGKDQIFAVSKAGMERSKQDGLRITGYKDVVIHETTDPEVIIAEFTLEGETNAHQAFKTPYIQVERVRDGKIVSLKDYFPREVLKSALRTNT
jgi:ketosteroid isomerase-like protein